VDWRNRGSQVGAAFAGQKRLQCEHARISVPTKRDRGKRVGTLSERTVAEAGDRIEGGIKSGATEVVID